MTPRAWRQVVAGLHGAALGYPSGGCALLWLRRSIAFHCELFDEVARRAAAAEATDEAAAATPARGAALAGGVRGAAGAAAAGLGRDEGVPAAAALVAYGSALEPCHGWVLQQAYKSALRRTMPPTSEPPPPSTPLILAQHPPPPRAAAAASAAQN